MLSCNSHKHISPSTRFVVNTSKPTRGGTRCTYNLPFLVIDDKLVEVFNGDKSMWNCKRLRYCLDRWQKGSPWRCAYKCFALECKCTWQVVLVEILFTIWRQYIMHEQIYKNNDMHNEKWTSAEWLHAGFIIAHAEFIVASQNSRKSSGRPSRLSVTTQRTNCIKTRVVNTKQKV